MRRLILLRHAKAEPRAPGGEDIDRPLAPRGRHDADVMGRLLARQGLAPDLALVSSAKRTQETWECIAPTFPAARLQLVDELYNATFEEIQAEAEDAAPACETMIVIGHNPGMHELAVNLLIDGGASPSDIERMSMKFPTSTAAVFAIDGQGRAAYDGLYFAREHGGDGD